MSGDLISREALLTELNDEGSPYTIGITIDPNDTPKDIVDKTLKAYRTVLIQMVNDIPTAYDVEKVLQEIGDLRDTTINTEYTPCETYGTNCVDKAMEIVKGGGKYELN